MSDASTPKLFISYSWSNPDHEEWVIKLASELVEAGIDVTLDKWHLREGHDAVAFMEKMVTDKDMKKVIMVCDRVYAEKTDSRHGGVGTEAQIISAKIYAEADQNKFVAVLAERDEHGKPYLPTYYQSRIFIDLSDEACYAENFDKLLRWAYDKPLHFRPELGKRPAFLDESDAISLGTSVKFNRAVDALRNDRGYAMAAVGEYFDVVVENIGRFVIREATDATLDDQIIESVEKFKPYRDEIIDLLSVLVQHRRTDNVKVEVHRFFERLIPYMSRPEDITKYFRDQFDNMKFIIHELFLCFMAILIRREKFMFAAHMLDTRYFVKTNSGSEMESFCVFRDYAESFSRISKKKNRASIRADLLEKRSHASKIDFRSIMQADLVLFTRALQDQQRNTGGYWWPESLLYATFNHQGAMEIFARSVSKVYFKQIMPMLGIIGEGELQETNRLLEGEKQSLPRWNYSHLPWAYLVNLEKLGTQP